MGELSFVKVSSVEPVAKYVAEAISSRLAAGQRVLWLLSGGSAISVAIEVAKLLSTVQLGGLTVGLVDERYGPLGHTDSNWKQLESAGLVLKDAEIVPVLHQGDDLQVTAQKYEVKLEGMLNKADYRLALFGIGADHHTAGILPGSAAATAETVVARHESPQFTRITMTAEAISRLNEGVVYVLGEAKRPALDALQKEQDPSKYPSQLLKRIPKVTVFNDQIGAA